MECHLVDYITGCGWKFAVWENCLKTDK